MRRIPNELKIPFIQMEKIFSQFIDKYLKIEEVEYLIHYVKFKMWLALFYVNYLCFPNIFEFWWLYIFYPNLHRDWQLGFWMLL